MFPSAARLFSVLSFACSHAASSFGPVNMVLSSTSSLLSSRSEPLGPEPSPRKYLHTRVLIRSTAQARSSIYPPSNHRHFQCLQRALRVDILWGIRRRSRLNTLLRSLDHVAALAASDGQLHIHTQHTSTHNTHTPLASHFVGIMDGCLPYRCNLAHAWHIHSKKKMHARIRMEKNPICRQQVSSSSAPSVLTNTFLTRTFHDKSGLLPSDFGPPLAELWSCLSLATSPSADWRAVWLGLQAATHRRCRASFPSGPGIPEKRAQISAAGVADHDAYKSALVAAQERSILAWHPAPGLTRKESKPSSR